MKKIIALSPLLLAGCPAIIVAAVVAGAVAVGTYSYVNNRLERNYDASLGQTHQAVKQAIHYLKLPSEKDAVDFQRGEFRSRMADGRRVAVEMEKATEKSTKVVVIVGDFESDANKQAAQKIHEEIYHQLTGKYEK